MHRSTISRSSSPIGPCSCGLVCARHRAVGPPDCSLSVPFEVPNACQRQDDANVDCTLSLGTPSTRQRKALSCKDVDALDHHPCGGGNGGGCGCGCPSSSASFMGMSLSAWDILQVQAKQQKQRRRPGGLVLQKSRWGSSGSSSILNNLSGDTLLARRCANCDTISTPLWRNGPRGPKSLCNACGIRYKKEERRATAMENPQQHQLQQHLNLLHQHHTWSTYAFAQAQAAPPNSAAHPSDQLRLVHYQDDRHRELEADIGFPSLSWTLNASPDFPLPVTGQVSSTT